jgi:hypothetical protein
MICALSVLLLLVSLGLSDSPVAEQGTRGRRTAADALFQRVRAFAEASENEDSIAAAKIDGLVSAVSDAEVLFNLIVKLRHREIQLGEKHDGACHACLRYFGAYLTAMDTLSELATDEAAQLLVRLMTVESCGWQGMPLKQLLYSISVMGQPALPHLEILRGRNPLAQMIIDIIHKGELFW